MRPLGEADRILSLFSRERGKLTAVAKGARKTQSKFGARLEFFARSRLTLHAGRNLDVITGAALVGGDWDRLVEPDVFAFVSYVAEVVDGLCEPEFPVPEIFDLLCEVQGALSARIPTGAMRQVFDLRLLSALGFGLELDACARCGTALGARPFAGGRAALSPDAGGLVCRCCLDAGLSGEGDARREFGIAKLSAQESASLRQAREATFADAARSPQWESLARVTHAFVQHHLGRSARALASSVDRARDGHRVRAGSATSARP
jgi:DNA repair protein RecO (recombination protein O)